MPAHQGYFCLIQDCPDRARMEAVNVGLVLFLPLPVPRALFSGP
jgi:hypothetical protein